MDNKRININVPVPLLKQIDEYQEGKAIGNRTIALLELVRKGLEKDKGGK